MKNTELPYKPKRGLKNTRKHNDRDAELGEHQKSGDSPKMCGCFKRPTFSFSYKRVIRLLCIIFITRDVLLPFIMELIEGPNQMLEDLENSLQATRDEKDAKFGLTEVKKAKLASVGVRTEESRKEESSNFNDQMAKAIVGLQRKEAFVVGRAKDTANKFNVFHTVTLPKEKPEEYLPTKNEDCPSSSVNFDTKIEPMIKLNPNKFLTAALAWGPNNQLRGLRETIYLAIRLNRTLVIPPFFKHRSDQNATKEISDGDTKLRTGGVWDKATEGNDKENNAMVLAEHRFSINALRQLIPVIPAEQMIGKCDKENDLEGKSFDSFWVATNEFCTITKMDRLNKISKFMNMRNENFHKDRLDKTKFEGVCHMPAETLPGNLESFPYSGPLVTMSNDIPASHYSQHVLLSPSLLLNMWKFSPSKAFRRVRCPSPLRGVDRPSSLRGMRRPSSFRGVRRPSPFLGVFRPSPCRGVRRPSPFREVRRPSPFRGVRRPSPFRGVCRPSPFRGVCRPSPFRGVRHPPPLPGEVVFRRRAASFLFKRYLQHIFVPI